MFVVGFRKNMYWSDCIFRKIVELGLERSMHSSTFQKKYKYSTMSIQSIFWGNGSIYQTFYPKFSHEIDLSAL